MWTTRIDRTRLSTLSKIVSPARRRTVILGTMSVVAERRLLDQLFARWGPVVHARDARTAGLPRGMLVRAVDRADLIRIGKAAFVRSRDWDAAGERERFRLRSLAFGLGLRDDAHLTGPAAALLLGLPLVDVPVGLPVAIRPGDAHTGHDRSPYGRVRHGYLPLTCRTERSRVRVVSPAFCAVDIARHLGPRDGLVAADAVLHAGADREAMTRIAENMLAYPGIESVAWVAGRADPRPESPLESLCRYAFLADGRRPPLSNAWIGTGSRWFRVDHLLPDDGVVLEGDGNLKYRDRPDADAIVRDEKERERLIRGLGYGVVRYTWADAVGRPGLLLNRVAEAIRLRQHAPVPTGWRLDPPWLDGLDRTATMPSPPGFLAR